MSFIIKQDYESYQTKTFRIPSCLISQMEKLANKNRISLNKLLIQCIEYSLQNLDDD